MAFFASGTRMQNLGNHGDYSVHALGDKLYAFIPGQPTTHAIISAHGGHHLVSNVNQFTTPAGVTLNFYGPDQRNLFDPGMRNFYVMRQSAQVVETIAPGNPCFNYILTKYQTAPSPNAESYESIGTILTNEVQALQNLQNVRARYIQQGNHAMAQVKANQAALHPQAAVITVRNRRFRSNVNLKEVLTAVRGAFPGLVTFDCLFCRGHFWSDATRVGYQ